MHRDVFTHTPTGVPVDWGAGSASHSWCSLQDKKTCFCCEHVVSDPSRQKESPEGENRDVLCIFVFGMYHRGEVGLLPLHLSKPMRARDTETGMEVLRMRAEFIAVIGHIH